MGSWGEDAPGTRHIAGPLSPLPCLMGTAWAAGPVTEKTSDFLPKHWLCDVSRQSKAHRAAFSLIQAPLARGGHPVLLHLPSVTPRRTFLLPQPQFPHLLSTGGCSGGQPIGPEGCMRVQEHCPHFQEPSGLALPEPGHTAQQTAKTSSNQTRSVSAAMHRPLQTRPLASYRGTSSFSGTTGKEGHGQPVCPLGHPPSLT